MENKLPYNRLADRKEMSNEQWLAIRKNGIGGSEAGAIAGLNPYSSAYTVWLDKIGEGIPIEETESIRQGSDLEDYVAKRFSEKTGKKIKKCNFVLRSKKYPFMLADIDRMIVGENAILECKTTCNYDRYDFAAGEYPAYWLCQIYHYMAVTGAEKAYLAVLEFGRGFYVFQIDRSEEDINGLIDMEKWFWEQYVLSRRQPTVDGSQSTTDAISARCRIADDALPTVDLSAYDKELKYIEEIKYKIKALELEKKGFENSIKTYMNQATIGESDGFRVSWKNSVRTSVDSEKLKKELPNIYEQYSKSTEIRTFLINSIK